MTKKKQPAGDRSFIENLEKLSITPSDIDGFLTQKSERGDEYLVSEDSEPMNREEAIRTVAREEGIQNPEGDLEELLKAMKEKRKKKTLPYEPKVDRPGL